MFLSAKMPDWNVRFHCTVIIWTNQSFIAFCHGTLCIWWSKATCKKGIGSNGHIYYQKITAVPRIIWNSSEAWFSPSTNSGHSTLPLTVLQFPAMLNKVKHPELFEKGSVLWMCFKGIVCTRYKKPRETTIVRFVYPYSEALPLSSTEQ